MRLFSDECLREPVVQKRINNIDRKFKHCWKLDDEANVEQAAPTFQSFDPDIVPRENEEELDLMLDGPPDPYYFKRE